MSHRSDLSSELAAFYAKFSMSNGDHESMLGTLNYVGLSSFDFPCILCGYPNSSVCFRGG